MTREYTLSTGKGVNDFEQQYNPTECVLDILGLTCPTLSSWSSLHNYSSCIPAHFSYNTSCLDQNAWNHAGLFFFIFYVQCCRKSCHLSHQNMFRIQSLHTAQCYYVVQVIMSCSAYRESLLVHLTPSALHFQCIFHVIALLETV